MKNLSLLLAFALASVFFTTKAQVGGPTLQAGLNGISFSKGNLDAALIAEIIAEKQGELKNRLIKEMLLNSLGVDNGLFYTYIENTIDIIVNEKNEKTRVRNLVENTVNLAFVTLYADYYYSTAKEGSMQLHHIRELANACGVDTTLIEPNTSLRKLATFKFKNSSRGFYKPNKKDSATENMNTFISIYLDITAETIRRNQKLKSLGLMRTSYLQNQSKTDAFKRFSENYSNKGLGTITKDDKSFLATFNTLNATINDGYLNSIIKTQLSQYKKDSFSVSPTTQQKINSYYTSIKTNFNSLYSIIINDSTYKKIKNEFFFSSHAQLKYSDNSFDSFFYEMYGVKPSVINIRTSGTNKYQAWSDLYRILDIKFKFDIISKIINQKSYADAILDDESENLNLLIKYIGIIKTLANKGTNVETVWRVLDENFSCDNDKGNLLDSIETTLNSARQSIGNIASLTKSDLKAFTDVNGFLNNLKIVEANSSQYLAQYENEIKPALTRLSKYSQQYLVVQDLMFTKLFCVAKSAKKDLRILGLNIDNSFITAFSRIDEFDRAATYQDYLNQLADLGDIFSSEKMRNAINIVSSFVRSYLTVKQDSASSFSINIDAEGFIVSLQRLNYNKFNPWGLHLTVGTNAVSFNRPLTLGDGSTINNYSFIGEKIGVKYKLYDNKYLKSFSKGETFKYWKYPWFPFIGKTTYVRNAPPKEPILSNVHLLAYGSGILYNLVNTGTTNNFNSPLVGAGLGLTFYNGLDINFSLGTAIVSDKPFLDKSIPFYFNLGMDIQFVEYIDRLNQKRKANQTQKRLAQATANAKD